MNSSSHIKTQKLTGENWVKGRETIQFYKSGMNDGTNVNISVIIKSSHYTPPGISLELFFNWKNNNKTVYRPTNFSVITSVVSMVRL